MVYLTSPLLVSILIVSRLLPSPTELKWVIMHI